jgi:predicted Zn-dependent peptidase
MVRRSELPNRARVVSERITALPSVTLGVWVENGSRFERREQGGISHFLEHLLFKGTERRSATQLAEEIDALGGVLNAFTGKEYTCYYARVLAEHFDIAADLLADLFLHSRFDEEEIERERTVVLQEISQGEDTPDDYIHDLFNLRYWENHPLSFPVCGTADTVGGFRRADFVSFLESRYRPDRIIVAASGDVEHERLEAWAADTVGSLGGTAEVVDGIPPQPKRGVFGVERQLEQVHVCLGTNGVPQTSDERFPGYVLNTALGGGMSSRLFQEVRERRGKAYSVYSFLNSYRDAGYLGVYVGTSPESVNEVVEVVLGELRALAKDGLRPDELTRSKNQLKGNLLLGLETTDARMSRLAKNEIYFGRDVPIEELSRSIEATTNDEIVALASRLVRPESTAIALLGELDSHGLDESMLEGL